MKFSDKCRLFCYRHCFVNPKTHRRAWEVLRRVMPIENAKGAELGVYRGTLSRLLLQSHKTMHLSMVDSWEAHGAAYAGDSGDAKIKLDTEDMDKCKQNAANLTSFADSRRVLIQKRTGDAAEQFENNSLDFVFIDADHSYEGCKSDIELWLPKVKKGGWLCGHDYDHPKYPQFGVKKAVDEFAANTQQKLEVGLNYTWFIKV